MAGEIKCENCSASAVCVITYLRENPRERVCRPLCQHHARTIWGAMSVPLRETAIIKDCPRSSADRAAHF